MKGVIVSNATPIIAFSRINRLDLFQQVTGAIVIPQEVEKELYGHRRTDVKVPVNDRQRWFLEQLAAGKQSRASDLAAHGGISEKTAKRDIFDLKRTGLIEFVGGTGQVIV